MTIIIWLTLLQPVFLLCLAAYGTHRILLRPPCPPLENPLPATVIIPVTGDTPFVRAALASLLAQSPRPLRTILSVWNQEDPAHKLCTTLADGREDVRVATGCTMEAMSRKIANQLAGLKSAHPASRAYLFFDAGHVATPDLAARLLEPLLQDRAVVSSGYHSVVPGSSPGALLHAASVLFLHVMQNMPLVSQPWGGAMAIAKKTFEELGIAELWKTNVVDDCSLAALLQRKRIAPAIVPGAITITRQHDVDFTWWWEWWIRQLQYMKYCFPGTWILTGLGLSILSLTMTFALFCWMLSPMLALISWSGFMLAAMILRRGQFHPPAAWKFVISFAAFLILTLPAYVTTCLRKGIVWRGVRYEVRSGGVVTAMTRTPEAP